MKSAAVIFLLIGACYGKLVEWSVEDYPNPRSQPGECGRYLDRPSFVCDPNKIISLEAGTFLHAYYYLFI